MLAQLDGAEEEERDTLRWAIDKLAQIEQAAPAAPQPAEPVAWRDHVEQRMRTWQQSFINKSGDQLALDDFMDARSLDDLIDFVCDEYVAPPQPTAEQVRPNLWAVLDEDGTPCFATNVDAEHCHEHINDALDRGIIEAAKWVVRPYRALDLSKIGRGE
jgi:hypothetical protein